MFSSSVIEYFLYMPYTIWENEKRGVSIQHDGAKSLPLHVAPSDEQQLKNSYSWEVTRATSTAHSLAGVVWRAV